MEARGLFAGGPVSKVCRTEKDNIFSTGKLERSNEGNQRRKPSEGPSYSVNELENVFSVPRAIRAGRES